MVVAKSRKQRTAFSNQEIDELIDHLGTNDNFQRCYHQNQIGDVAKEFVKEMSELHPGYERSSIVIRNKLKDYRKKYIEVRDREENSTGAGLEDLSEGSVEQRKERMLYGYARFHELYTTKDQNGDIAEPNVDNALRLLETESVYADGENDDDNADTENENGNDNSFEDPNENESNGRANSSRMETDTAPTSTSAPRRRTSDRYDSPLYGSEASVSTNGRDGESSTGQRNKRQRKDDVSNLLSQITDTAGKSIADKLTQSKRAIDNQAAYQSHQLVLEEKSRTQTRRDSASENGARGRC
ncbi:hypothetical protein TRICI_005062 [Trichomonascus ciferrii]|uniref:Uncharacterized protein n=1 Tax=Trichomonascus ciferrii TaxID=44093 RepID=A0A642UW42_9ASCO|nr:hypothetical protein TRICI_005062 [Trichomonascus ciferrii]